MLKIILTTFYVRFFCLVFICNQVKELLDYQPISLFSLKFNLNMTFIHINHFFCYLNDKRDNKNLRAIYILNSNIIKLKG